MKKVSFNHKGKRFELDVKECKGVRRGIGLMFKPKNTSALLFNFDKPTRMAIHSWFVFFSFFAVWIDEKGEVVEVRMIRPFTFSTKPKKSYKKFLEILVSKKYSKILQLLDGN